ncbi:MAG: hypothetical protein ABEK16_01985 [Candidatus Nanohalobium sp.]
MSAFDLGEYGFDSSVGSYSYIAPELAGRSISDFFEIGGLDRLYSNDCTEAWGDGEYVVTFSNNSDNVYSTLEVIDEIGLPFASTLCGRSEPPGNVFGGGEDSVSVTIQPHVHIDRFLENAEEWEKEFRAISHQADSHGYEIDMGPRNFGIIDGVLVYHDVADSASVMESESPLESMAHWISLGFHDVMADERASEKPFERIIDDWGDKSVLEDLWGYEVE